MQIADPHVCIDVAGGIKDYLVVEIVLANRNNDVIARLFVIV